MSLLQLAPGAWAYIHLIRVKGDPQEWWPLKGNTYDRAARLIWEDFSLLVDGIDGVLSTIKIPQLGDDEYIYFIIPA